MSKNFTKAQIASFVTFRNEVEEFMNSHSEGTKTFRKMDAPTFLAVFKVASQPTLLRPVANNVTKLGERGFTKRNSVKRTPQGHIRYDERGNELRTKDRVVMYTTEAYRETRARVSGLKKTETVYAIRWDEVPVYIQKAISRVFPLSKPEYPAFVPKNLCMVLRHGTKEDGSARHAWGGFDFCVSGFYGETAVVIPQVAVKRRVKEEGSTTENIARVCNATCPDWGQNEEQDASQEQEEAPIATAANVLSLIAEDVGF